ncbi:hypothetical protein KUTeg_011810 [Tegillarca granosa]|uniref:Glucose-methanol-choline oxidoreductase C-terminal domain-containing protein n=1 Tax=Tegillarca granosa TaxID=220873 RepID=A0ABQ9F2Y4_TEGGR|nr:hypothetical protein KUTeg_011810 [Tegillarca granosa]
MFIVINSSNLVTKKNEPISSLLWLDGQIGPILPSSKKTEGDTPFNEGPISGFDFSAVPSDKNYLTVYPLSAKPKSKGNVRLRSNNYTDLPVINPNFLSSYFDVKVFLESIRYIQELLKTPSLRSIGAALPPPSSACKWFDYDSDSYWECFIRTFAIPSYHGIGTCRMGEGDKTVLDSRLRVKGIKRLRVADASVMPTSPYCNTMASVYMIAEKAAQMIKEDLHTLQ